MLFDDLRKCLASALHFSPKVYCVVDALDEMEPRHDQFLLDLVNLGRQAPKSIKLILTSRQLSHLEKHLMGSCLVNLRPDRRNVDQDIAVYIAHRLDDCQSNLSAGEANEIRQAICERGKRSVPLCQTHARLAFAQSRTNLWSLSAGGASSL